MHMQSRLKFELVQSIYMIQWKLLLFSLYAERAESKLWKNKIMDMGNNANVHQQLFSLTTQNNSD